MHTHHNNDTQRARVLVWRALATLSSPPQKKSAFSKKKKNQRLVKEQLQVNKSEN